MRIVLIASILAFVASCSLGPNQYRRYYAPNMGQALDFNTEEYDRIYENEFQSTLENPKSTFSIDVDAASYSNVRRFIMDGQVPPKDAVRIEEFINYFSYDYAAPESEDPFSIHTEISDCPWSAENKLLHVGLQGREFESEKLAPSNLVFLLDVSGSMGSSDKLPLLKSSFHLLLNQLDSKDKVAIVVYAGAAGVVLPSTECDKKDEILDAINNLEAGGSTAGGAGIQLAYKLAKENFIEDGNNRIILATDGDFNVGVSSDAELTRLVEEKRRSGIYLSVLGFGTGNLKDSKMEKLADNGNGNYYYIDNLLEAKKVLVSELGGTLHTIARDVKIQLEFNPTKVFKYRLIGYENRILSTEDFEDQEKDAGELGAGHTVTALYEIIPKSQDDDQTESVDYRYQSTKISEEAYNSAEFATIRFRYKAPTDTTNFLIEQYIQDKQRDLENASSDYKFAASVAQFGLLLRDSEYKGNSTYEDVLVLAQSAKGADEQGYRSEFIRLVGLAKELDSAGSE